MFFQQKSVLRMIKTMECMVSQEIMTFTGVRNAKKKAYVWGGMVMEQDKYIGTVVDGKYSVINRISQGVFYSTYLVRSVGTNKIWLLKACDKTNKKYNAYIRDALLQEAHMMMKLHHPAIPQIIDIVEDDNSIFIVREYVEGETLELLYKNYGAQPAYTVIEWGKQLCDVLRYLHNLTPPYLYRDMKPGNIILTPDGTLKLIDFGTVIPYNPEKNGDDQTIGTTGYAPPEQYEGHTTPQSDIFGLGMTLHQLVTGVDPKISLWSAKPICQINASLPKGLEYIISKCTQHNLEDRYQNCDELMNDLNNYMNLPKPKGILGRLFGKK